ncbi:enhancer of yellow 2 transcription factor-like [Contarinia nasturtii]|uniref:enhancer of yellow 2 transcription factor-like n=1 Tax=Contarinia nasturtii TaxID=265458 RepID=UPI0012D46A19|nr:enhancer of yellow 2 transcription factor-like [Contarinia nasturtii]
MCKPSTLGNAKQYSNITTEKILFYQIIGNLKLISILFYKHTMTLTKAVDQMTILLGDRAKLKDLLRLRLTECGWNDEVRLLCRDVIKEDGGNVNAEKIVKQVTPKARALVPDAVKRELLQKIKTILSTQGGVDI